MVFAMGLKVCAVNAKIKKHNSIIKKKKKKQDKMVLLAKTKLNSAAVLISKALVDTYISHEEFVSVLVNKVLRGNDHLT